MKNGQNKKNITKKKSVPDEQAFDAQKNMLEEIFYDIYPNRWKIYKINFLRGLAFGLGSFIGATVLVILIIMILSLFVNIPGGVGEFIQKVIDTMKK